MIYLINCETMLTFFLGILDEKDVPTFCFFQCLQFSFVHKLVLKVKQF